MGKKKRAETKKEISQEMQSEVIIPFYKLLKKHLVFIFIFLAITAGVYSNSLFNGFVYDDEFTIVNNTMIKNFSNLSKLWTKEYFTTSGEMSYRPVVTFTYFLDYAMYGIKPWGYHLTNLLLHAMNGVLLYIFLFWSAKACLRFQKREQALALQISLIFITHPVLTEAVNAISFREDLLCFLFFISAAILYVECGSLLPLLKSESKLSHSKGSFLYALSCFFYLLALLSKEMAITLPLIIFLYEWIYNSPAIKGVRGLFNRYNIGYIAVTIFYLYIRFFLFKNPVEETLPVWLLSERLMTLPYLLLKYIMLLIAPVSLSADYVITPVQSLISLKFIIPFIIVSALVLVSVNSVNGGQRSKHITGALVTWCSGAPNIVFGMLFLLLTLLPVYNIIPIVNPLAERYLYLPMVGFAIIVGFVIHEIFTVKTTSPLRGEEKGEGWFFKRQNLYILAVSVLILSLYSFAVIKRNKIWLDDYSLWSDTVIKMPESSRAHNNLGIVYSKQDKFDEAIREYKLVLFLKPDYPEAYNNLGNAYYDKGLFDKAIEHFQIALKLKPDYPQAYYNLGYAYYDKGLFDKAIEHFQIALKLKPDYPEAYNNLGTIYGTSGLLDRAIEHFQIALKLKPDYPEAYYNMGNALVGQERYSDAIPHYIEAIKIKPNYAEAHNNLGSAYVKLRQWENALKEWNDTLTLDPKNENARQNRDMVMRMLGR